MWYKYLVNKIYEELDIIERLAMIDDKIQGSNTIKDLISFLENDNRKIIINNEDLSDNTIILDGDTKVLILVLNDLIDKKNKVIINRSNLGLNKWIVTKYFDFIDEVGLSNKISVDFKDTFNNKDNYIIIGESEFVNEMKNNLTNVKKSIDTDNI